MSKVNNIRLIVFADLIEDFVYVRVTEAEVGTGVIHQVHIDFGVDGVVFLGNLVIWEK